LLSQARALCRFAQLSGSLIDRRSCVVPSWGRIVGMVAVWGALGAGAPAAMGATADVVFDGGDVTLTEADGGGWKATVGATNLTGDAIPVEVVKKAGPKDCLLSADTGDANGLPAARHTDITVKIDARCKAGESSAGYPFDVTAGGQTLSATAKAKSTSKVAWGAFWGFIGGLVGATLVVALVAENWRWRSAPNASVPPPSLWKGPWLTPLKGLEKSWSFKDSWVTNLTAAGGVVIGLFGSSEFLKAALGDKAEATVGAATIAGLVAVALTGAAGVLTQTIRKRGDKHVSFAGFLAGAAVAFGAAAGQIATIAVLLDGLDLGFAAWVVWVAAGLALLLLFSYALTSIPDVLTEGTKPDPPGPQTRIVPTEVYAAAIVAAAQPGYDGVDHERVEGILEALVVEDATKAEVVAGARQFLFAPPPAPLSEHAALP
jgi:hypothetical protein